jgi:hypothetical protein
MDDVVDGEFSPNFSAKSKAIPINDIVFFWSYYNIMFLGNGSENEVVMDDLTELSGNVWMSKLMIANEYVEYCHFFLFKRFTFKFQTINLIVNRILALRLWIMMLEF